MYRRRAHETEHLERLPVQPLRVVDHTDQRLVGSNVREQSRLRIRPYGGAEEVGGAGAVGLAGDAQQAVGERAPAGGAFDLGAAELSGTGPKVVGNNAPIWLGE